MREVRCHRWGVSTWLVALVVVLQGFGAQLPAQDLVKARAKLEWPGKTWTKREPEAVALDPVKLEAFARSVGGRGCVVRRGYLVFSWGNTEKRGDVASAAKPFYSHFLFHALETRKISRLDEAAARVEPRLATARVTGRTRRTIPSARSGTVACVRWS